MITSVQVFSPSKGGSLYLDILSPSNGLVVQEIDGLDPVKASITSSRLAQVDGTHYQASRRDSRNIIIKVDIDPYLSDDVHSTVESIRAELYDYLMPESLISLRFQKDGVTFVEIAGMVESLEAPLFTDTPGAVISVLCFDPDFVSTSDKFVKGTALPSTTGKDFTYDGTAETGFIFEMVMNRSAINLALHHSVYGRTTTFELATSLLTGDRITIDTRTGMKSVMVRTAGGVSTSRLAGVSPASKWPTLKRGVNNIRALVVGAGIPWDLTYREKYGGL